MYELDPKEGWALIKWCFRLWCWRRLLRVPWTARRSHQSILKEINPEYSLEGLMPKLKLQNFGNMMWRAKSLEKDPDAGKNWRQKKKRVTDGEVVRWHHQLSGHEFEKTLRDSTGKRSLTCCSLYPKCWIQLCDLTTTHLTKNVKGVFFDFWAIIVYLACWLEKAMATHSSTLAWKIPWTEKPGGLQSMGSLGVRHDWAASLSLSRIGEGNGNPLQCSCLENPRDGGTWWATVYGVTQSQTRLKRLSSSSSSSLLITITKFSSPYVNFCIFYLIILDTVKNDWLTMGIWFWTSLWFANTN